MIQAEAWKPTLKEVAALLTLSARGRMLCSHFHFGQWSFWIPGNATHAVLCHSTGAFYLTRQPIDAGRSEWADKRQVLNALGLLEDEV